MPPWDAALETTFTYHEQTKHHPDRYARSAGYLDWASQPNPFREFAGSPRIELPLAREEETPPFDQLVSGRHPLAQPLNLKTLGLFFELSFAISAWKESAGARWALRINPSSGNLHPTEAYALLPALDGIASHSGAYHYLSRDHALELRCRWENEAPAGGGFHLALTSIAWREAWKYGERAFRYCQHDVGHALAAIRFSAATLGWTVRLRSGFGEVISRILALDPPAHPIEREIFEALVWIETDPRQPCSSVPSLQTVLQWFGTSNQLSQRHAEWSVIESVAIATAAEPEALPDPLQSGAPWPVPAALPCLVPAGVVIRQRRSAVDFDGSTPLSRASFLQLLDLTLPRTEVPPFDMWHLDSSIHLVLFVHRVTDLAPGLYLWVRNLEHLDSLRAAFRPGFQWQCEQPRQCPLFQLGSTDLRGFAKKLSCHQDIAADGAFSLGMLARFEPLLRERGPHAYRELFWEAGMIGQSLYLGAEAAGVRATGIGCYFDDVLHEALGLQDRTWQSLYHFTVGSPVEDSRLRTAPPYGSKTG